MDLRLACGVLTVLVAAPGGRARAAEPGAGPTPDDPGEAVRPPSPPERPRPAPPPPGRAHTAGLVLLGSGIVIFTAGDVLSDVYLVFRGAQVLDHEAPPKLASDVIVPGVAIAAVGAVMFLTGGGLYLATRTTTGAQPAPAATPAAPATETSPRRPSWLTADGPRPPPPFTVPVVDVRF